MGNIITKELLDVINRVSVINILKAKHNKNLLEEVYHLTIFLDKKYDNVSLIQRIWHIRNKNYELCHCKICGKPLQYSAKKSRYSAHVKCVYKLSELEHSELPELEQKKLLFSIIKETKVNTHSKIISLKLTPTLKKITSFLDKKYDNIPLQQRIWHIRNDNYELHYCPICKKIMPYSINGCEYRVHMECLPKKIKSSYELKYPNKSFYAEHIIKSEKTNLLKYGVKNYSQTKEFKEKWKNTQIKKYGSIFSSSREFKEKIEQNFMCTLGKRLPAHIKYVKHIGDRKHKFYCNKCNNFFISASHCVSNRIKNEIEVCVICNPIKQNNSISDQETGLLDFIRSNYNGDIITNSRKIIKPYELDIYLPELNLAIEYNGLWWHSEKFKDKNYHKMKSNLCKDKGIHLMHVFEDDWQNKKSIIKSILLNYFQYDMKKIYARNCEIKEIKNVNEINNFLTNNHLLGKMKFFSKCYGLIHGGELVSLMLFKKLSEKNNYELSRYAIKLNHKIIGGANRLLKKFISENSFSEIITYNDNAIFKGDIYKKLGFSYIRTNAPNYVYYDKCNNCVISKQSIRRSVLGIEFTTEPEYAKSHKLFKIYNAGNDVYKLINH